MLKYVTCICNSQIIKKLIYSDDSDEEMEKEVNLFNIV